MSRYIPMPAYPDMMPVDISFVFEDEKPAGKHGFVRTDGHDLRFEDGTLARFWGVNFNTSEVKKIIFYQDCTFKAVQPFIKIITV